MVGVCHVPTPQTQQRSPLDPRTPSPQALRPSLYLGWSGRLLD